MQIIVSLFLLFYYFQVKDFEIQQEDIESLKELLGVVENAVKNKTESK